VSSSNVEVAYAASDPGIFTIDTTGPTGAIVLPDGNVNGNSTTAAARIRSSNSDVVAVYMTGLGIPSGGLAANNTPDSTPGAPFYPADCLTTGAYATLLNLGSLDGAVIQTAQLSSTLAVPCFNPTSFSATIGAGVSPAAPTPAYAGFAPNEVAGMYQVNLQLPPFSDMTVTSLGSTAHTAFLAGPTKVPVVVTLPSADATASQSNVMIWVQEANLITTGSGPIYSATPIAVGPLDTAVTLTSPGGSTITSAVWSIGTVTTASAAYSYTSGDFTISSTLGIGTFGIANITGLATGQTYYVPVTETDGSGLPVETIILTVEF
jgi:hypothetical protein